MKDVTSIVPSLEILIAEGKLLANDGAFTSSPKFKKWHVKSLGILDIIYGDSSSEYKKFEKIRFSPAFAPADFEYKVSSYRGGLDSAVALLESCSELLVEFGLPEGKPLVHKDSSGQTHIEITNNNSQQQFQSQQFIVEFREELDRKISNSSKEEDRHFLEKVKNGLGAVKNTAELVRLILDTAKLLGMDVSHVASIFS